MFKNFFKTAIRAIQRDKLISVINVFSLAIGISASLIIFLFVQYDLSFDKHVQHQERVYRVVSNGTYKLAGVLVPLANALETEASNLEKIVPIYKSYEEKIKIATGPSADFSTFAKDNKLIFTNSQYFDIYPHKWLSGNASSLSQANHIVLTDKNAGRFFPDLNAAEVLGKVISFGDSIQLVVSGVVREMKENSDFKYQGFISTATIPLYPTLKKIFSWESWTNYNDSYNLLLKLPKGVNPSSIEKTMLDLTNKYKNVNDGFKEKFELQPLSDVHFNPAYNYNSTNPDTLRNLIILAIFLLLLGVINFINLSTAKSTERAKEVGVRKTLGSSKAKLTVQFLTETFLIALSATLLSVLITPILFKAFDGFVPASLKVSNLLNLSTILFILGQLIVVTLLAGIYPAWIMTGYSPVMALKNQASKNSNLSRSSWVRKLMTVFQFVLAQVFLICVILVVKQISYMTHKDMGFEKDAILTFTIPGFYQNSDKGKVLKNKIADFPEVQAVSFGNQAPAFSGMMTTSIVVDKSNDKDGMNIDTRNGDEHYLSVYHIPLVAGRNIQPRDSLTEVLVNEKALELLKIKSPEEAIGSTLNKGTMTIVGVMKNFDIGAARGTYLKPLIYASNPDGFMLHIRLDKQHPESWKNTIDKISKSYKEIFPNDDFEFKFLDESIANFYHQEKRLSKLLTWAVSLSVIIAVLGLFGLGLFTANQKTKEIGIRKVLGASIVQIIGLLMKNLLSLVGIACLIAFPVAWFFGNKWLEEFAYRTEFSWWLFPLSAIGLLSIATLVLFSKSYLAARANPVNSLRDE